MVLHGYANGVTCHWTQTHRARSWHSQKPGFGEMREHIPGSLATMKKINSFHSHKQKLINVEWIAKACFKRIQRGQKEKCGQLNTSVLVMEETIKNVIARKKTTVLMLRGCILRRLSIKCCPKIKETNSQSMLTEMAKHNSLLGLAVVKKPCCSVPYRGHV